jgi:hypothetical protein
MSKDAAHIVAALGNVTERLEKRPPPSGKDNNALASPLENLLLISPVDIERAENAMSVPASRARTFFEHGIVGTVFIMGVVDI